jgi:hypothetical protein
MFSKAASEASKYNSSPGTIEIVFGREGRSGTRTIRITAMGENRTHNTVSTVSRVSDQRLGIQATSFGRLGGPGCIVGPGLTFIALLLVRLQAQLT